MSGYKLDIGCGHQKAKGFVGVDSFDWSKNYPKGEFILGHIPEVFSGFDDNTIECVRASHIMEHVPHDKVIETMNEIYRILVAGGLFEIFVPPTPGKGAFCDPTHVSFWNDLSFRYYDMSWCSDLSKSYGIRCNFKQVQIKLLTENNLHAVLKKV